MKWLSYIPEAIKAIVATIPLIKALVEMFETGGLGPEKKEQVLDALDKALEGLEIRESIRVKALEYADWLIDTLVFWKNKIEEFSRKESEVE